jgi:hypothetical protein
MAVKKLFSLLDSLLVIIADKRLEPYKMSVDAYGIDTIFRHGTHAELGRDLQSPVTAEGQGGDTRT